MYLSRLKQAPLPKVLGKPRSWGSVKFLPVLEEHWDCHHTLCLQVRNISSPSHCFLGCFVFGVFFFFFLSLQGMTVRRAFLKCPQWLLITRGEGLPWREGNTLHCSFLIWRGNSHFNPARWLAVKGAPGKTSDAWQALLKWEHEASYPIHHLDPCYMGNPRAMRVSWRRWLLFTHVPLAAALTWW